MAAGGDEDHLRAHLAAVAEHDRVRVGEDGARGNDLDAGLLEVLHVDAGEAGDLLLFRGDELCPIEGWLRHAPAEPFRLLEGVDEAARVDHQLLRHAAADDAGAADAELLGDHHFRAVLRGDTRGPRPAGAGTDDEEIDVELLLSRH